MLTLLATLLVAAPPTDSANVRAVATARAPAIQISLNNNGDYAPGSRVNAQVQTNDDGYLIVFRVDGDGRIRVLFPLDPDGDAFVRGGKEYELRGRGDQETFLADNQSGNGLVYAALSHAPYAFRDFVANGHWDYDALRVRDSSSDAETDITAIVAEMTNHTRFDYDAVGYRVQEIGTTAGYSGGGYYPGYYDPYYDPSWRCLGCGWGYPGNIGIGLNFGYSPYWDPYLYSPWGYSYYGYNGYNRGFGYGGYGYGGGFFPGYFPVTRRPLRNLPPGTRPRPRPTFIAPAGGVRGNNAPPSSSNGVNGRPRPSAGTNAPPPSARPAPPSGSRDLGTRARPRPMDMNVTPRGATPYARPTFREPPQGASPGVRYQRPQSEQSQARPVYREPPHVDRSPPPSTRSAPPPSQRSAQPPRSEPSRARPSGGGGHGRP